MRQPRGFIEVPIAEAGNIPAHKTFIRAADIILVTSLFKSDNTGRVAQPYAAGTIITVMGSIRITTTADVDFILAAIIGADE